MTKEELQKFCLPSNEASEGIRKAIGKPFSEGNYTYATDGHLIGKNIADLDDWIEEMKERGK